MQYRVIPEIRKVYDGEVPRHSALFGLFYRGLAWMKSLAVLEEPVNFQAVSAGVRSMFELCVEVLYIHKDNSSESAERMEFWEESAKLKAAEQTVSYYKGRKLPKEAKPMHEYFIKHEEQVKARRQLVWNRGKKGDEHPDRWYNKDLAAAGVDLDRNFGELAAREIGKTLTEFYRTEYQKLNWMTHGSAMIALRGNEEAIQRLTLMCALSRHDACNFAMFITKIVAEDFETSFGFSELNNDWKEIQLWRKTAIQISDDLY